MLHQRQHEQRHRAGQSDERARGVARSVESPPVPPQHVGNYESAAPSTIMIQSQTCRIELA